jgi:D-3-phosphoglycerate dehydrogenase
MSCLRVADVVTLHVPLVESTRGLIGEHELNVLKDSVFLVNCARGGVVDERALLQALDEKRFAASTVVSAIKKYTLENEFRNPPRHRAGLLSFLRSLCL